MSSIKNFLDKRLDKKYEVLKDSNGEPLILMHGTTRSFNEHSNDKNRTILNEKYQGDWICYSNNEKTAWKYSHAARNQTMDKETFIKETIEILKEHVDSELMDDLLKFTHIYLENSDDSWDIFEEYYTKEKNKNYRDFFSLIDNLTIGETKFDINDYCQAMDFVEYSKSKKSYEFDDIMNFFNAKIEDFPNYVADYLSDLGYKDSLPSPRIIKSYVIASNILRTDSREDALNAKNNGYDLVIYNGEDCVDGNEEYLIASEKQIFIQEIINKKIKVEYLEDNDGWTEHFSYDVIELKQPINLNINLKNKILVDDIPDSYSYTFALRDNKLVDVTKEFMIEEPHFSIEGKPASKLWVEKFNENDEKLKESLIALCEKEPSILNAKIRFDNNKPQTVLEYIYSSNEVKKLYHGTSSILLDSIMKNGLTFGNEPHFFNTSTLPSLKDRLYLCSENGIGAAKFAANSACSKYGGNPIIISVNMEDLNENLLCPDEDSKKKTWQESLGITGCIAYKGNISPEKININTEFNITNEKNKKEKKLKF